MLLDETPEQGRINCIYFYVVIKSLFILWKNFSLLIELDLRSPTVVWALLVWESFDYDTCCSLYQKFNVLTHFCLSDALSFCARAIQNANFVAIIHYCLPYYNIRFMNSNYQYATISHYSSDKRILRDDKSIELELLTLLYIFLFYIAILFNYVFFTTNWSTQLQSLALIPVHTV